jgi:hypothetical protein
MINRSFPKKKARAMFSLLYLYTFNTHKIIVKTRRCITYILNILSTAKLFYYIKSLIIKNTN